jgi:3-dehydroquinate synthase
MDRAEFTEVMISSQATKTSRIRFEGPDWEGLADWLRLRSGAVWVVSDLAVAESAETICRHLAEREIKILGHHRLRVSETVKSMAQLDALYGKMAQDGVTRDVWLVAIGGGVLTDLAGYAAASYLRGLCWVAVPTTLLAQVDAAIGGKVAVNLQQGKNLVGAFHLPELVYVNPDVLASLPIEGWRAGLGEVVKSALIAGGPLWQSLLEGVPELGRVDDRWRRIVATTATIKIDVVNRDLEEQGDRIYLNFGHTLAHGLEQMSGYGRFSHGQAVAMGSLLALYLSERCLGLDSEIRRTVVGWMEQWGLPCHLPTLDYAQLEPVLLRDKKARLSGLKWVLLESVGHPRVVPNVAREIIEQGLQELAGAV